MCPRSQRGKKRLGDHQIVGASFFMQLSHKRAREDRR